MNPSDPIPTQPTEPPADVQADARDGCHAVLTAQLCSNVSPQVGDNLAIEPLTGGAQPPSPPIKKRRKRRDKKVGIRIDDDLLHLITTHRASSGTNESDAIRQLILAGLGRPIVLITPKAPPEHLESYLGKMLHWERSLHGIQSRLNAPMPRDDSDTELTELVRQWREKSKALLEQIPSLVESAQAVAQALSSMTPEKIQKLRDCYPAIKDWQSVRQKKIDDPALEKEKGINQKWRDRYEAIIELIDDLGLQPKGGQ